MSGGKAAPRANRATLGCKPFRSGEETQPKNFPLSIVAPVEKKKWYGVPIELPCRSLSVVFISTWYVVDSANACTGLISMVLPEALILTPLDGGGKILMHFCAVFPFIHSEKTKVIFDFTGYFTVPIGGTV